MPWANEGDVHPFDRASIESKASQRSGVYGLFTGETWIYIGESNDIRRRLWEHLDGDNPCIDNHGPSHFKYEIWPEHQRVIRQNQLIQDYRPSCNEGPA